MAACTARSAQASACVLVASAPLRLVQTATASCAADSSSVCPWPPAAFLPCVQRLLRVSGRCCRACQPSCCSAAATVPCLVPNIHVEPATGGLLPVVAHPAPSALRPAQRWKAVAACRRAGLLSVPLRGTKASSLQLNVCQLSRTASCLDSCVRPCRCQRARSALALVPAGGS